MQARRSTNPYAVLGVPRDATPLQLARAHRLLAKQHHPDLHEGREGKAEAATAMRRVNEAWALLSDPVQRAEYDRTHPAAPSARSGHWASNRAPIHPAGPSSTRTWASWRASAAETQAAAKTVRQAGEVPVPRTRRPPRPQPAPPTFRDSGWAAVLAAAVIVVLLLGAIAAGRAFP